jgi:Ni/Co efflux regulator RcnB
MKRTIAALVSAGLIACPLAAAAQINPSHQKALQSQQTTSKDKATQMWKERQEAEKARQEKVKTATGVAKASNSGKTDAKKPDTQSKGYQMIMQDLGKPAAKPAGK